MRKCGGFFLGRRSDVTVIARNEAISRDSSAPFYFAHNENLMVIARLPTGKGG